jgi:hypothetical protein
MFTNRFTSLAMVSIIAVAIAGSLSAADPSERKDGSWITVSGTAVSPSADAFTLDYGQGTIRVEMDDWQGYRINDGNRVTVSGRIDDDFFETKSINASYVYDQNYSSYFYADATYESNYFWNASNKPIVLGESTLYGTVSSVDPDDRSFVLDTDKRKVTVTTNSMYYNPLDKVGYQRIEVGDRVTVGGQMKDGFFSDRKLEADSVITTFNASQYANAKAITPRR